MDKPPDPRIAALAEALRKTATDPTLDYRGWARDLLAALPTDWCGHSLTAIEDLMGEIEDRVRLLAEANHEIARLRKIEEAARAFMVPRPLTAPAVQPGGVTDGWEWPEWHALRAALEAEG